MNDDDLSQLRDDVRYLKDRTAIMDVVARHARGHDRHDVDLLTSTYADVWQKIITCTDKLVYIHI